MKKIIIVFVFLTNICFAQTKDNLDELLGQIKSTDLLKQCFAFKSQLELQVKEANRASKSTAQAKSLEKNYKSVSKKYDEFLKTIKKDLIDNKMLVKNTDASTKIYTNMLSAIRTDYNKNFLKNYNQLVGGKGLVEDLLNVGVGLVKNLIQKVKAKIPNKNEVINTLLPKLNKFLFNDLKLKTWSEMDLTTVINGANNQVSDSTKLQPVFEQISTPAPEQVVATSNTSNQANPVVESAVVSGNSIPSVSPIIEVPAATLGAMIGTINFVHVISGTESTMEFEQNNGKNIIVETDDNSTIAYKTPYFTTVQNYPVGTKFKILADASVFIYAIVLNTDGVALLHPYVKYANNGKNIEVISEASPTNGKLTLPSKGNFTIVASKDGNDSSTEDFALIVSKSELVMEETIEKLNIATGKLDERFSQVFADQQITYDEAQVGFNNGLITFSYQNGQKNVLPIVFKINKQ